MKFNIKGNNFRNIESLTFKDGSKQIVIYAEKREYIPNDDYYIAVWKKTYKLSRGKKVYLDVDPNWILKGINFKEGIEGNATILSK